MSNPIRPYLQIHFCVLLWGFTAILGKLISLPAGALVFWRMAIVTGALALAPRVWRALRHTPPHTLLAWTGIGVVVALHWLTFYGAIKFANASVAATCMALGAVFVALIEPLLGHRRLAPRELLLGLAVVPGVALVVGGISPSMRIGFAVGVLSAALTALFTVLNKRYATQADPLAVTGVEIGAGAIFLALVLPWWVGADAVFALPGARDVALLLTLAVACTILPFALSLVVMRHLPAFAVQLALNLEPVYAILLAIALLGEQRELTPAFYLGVAIVLGAVFAQPLVLRRRVQTQELAPP
jgi:drug/metabolite transporter (DMT)-like permease